MSAGLAATQAFARRQAGYLCTVLRTVTNEQFFGVASIASTEGVLYLKMFLSAAKTYFGVFLCVWRLFKKRKIEDCLKCLWGEQLEEKLMMATWKDFKR